MEFYDREVEYETIFDLDLDVDIINNRLAPVSPGIDEIYDPDIIHWPNTDAEDSFQTYCPQTFLNLCFMSLFYQLFVLLYFLYTSYLS